MARLFALALGLVFVVGTQVSCAQTGKNPAQAQAANQADARKTKPIKHIQHQDASNTIDEVREGAETKSIAVKPNNRMPGYDIVPASRHGVPAHRSNQPEGRRMWRLMNF